MVRNLVCLLMCSFTALSIIGQNNTPTYTWRMHLPYFSVQQVVEASDKLYVHSNVGVYSIGLNTGEVEFLTKVNGFTETNVERIGYSDEYTTLVIAYASGNIDLLKDNKIINIPAVLRSSIVGLKTVNDITFNNNFAYLATTFGVVVLDIDKEEVVDDYQNLSSTGESIEILSVEWYNDSLYLGTTDGLKKASTEDRSANLKNFTTWSTNNSFDSVLAMEVFNGSLYLSDDNIVYSYDGSFSEVINNGSEVKSLVKCHDNLVLCEWAGITLIDENGGFTDKRNSFNDYAILDAQNNLWLGGFYTSLVKETPSGSKSYLTPPGPRDKVSYDMDGVGNSLWVTSGGHTTAYGPSFISTGFYRYEDGAWFNRNEDGPFDDMFDFTNVFIDKNANEVWIGSFGKGLLQIRNNELLERYNNENSTINSGPGGRDVALGMAKDGNGNLWVSNFETERALAVRRTDGNWEDFNVGTTVLGEMLVDDRDVIWAIVPRNNSRGILAVQEDNGVLQRRFLNTGTNNGGLPNNNVKAIALDKDGEIWVGTEAGLAIFYNPSLVFDGGANADAQQIIIDDGNDIGYLLGNEVINDIKVDGANRKWVATNNGVWLVREDGSAIERHLTSENSPLPNNVVTCIGIIPNTGEVFFGTNDGIASYRSDATEATDFNNNPLVFPNPVDKGYEGPITVTGLPEDATVKILDVAGRVVYEMIANGGTAVWDGRNFNGEKPQSGVYLLFSANKEGEEAFVTKLLIVR